MGIDNPTIFCGDDTADLEMHIVEICGLELYDYFEDEKILTRELFHENFDEILEWIENWSPEYQKYNNIAWQILGAFILKLGAKLPYDIKDKITKSTNWEIDQEIKWPANWIFQRKLYLDDLKNKIKKYKYGNATHLIGLSITDDYELFNCSIGLNELKYNIKNKKIKQILHINLDSCNLRKIPDLIYELDWIKTLSLNGNKLNYIDKEIKKLENLEELSLRYNYIESIPESMKTLTKLRILDASFNRLKLIPKFLIELGGLPGPPTKGYNKGLFLYNNPLNNIPPEFERFTIHDSSYMKKKGKANKKSNSRIQWYI